MPGNAREALIIGAGHNGLVCAFYLARRGWRVRLLERRGVAGGAVVTEEFHPGFRNSIASYTVGLLNPQIIRDMQLGAHGLRILERPLNNFLPLPDGRYLKVGGGLQRTQAELGRFSQRDAQRLPAYYQALQQVADRLRALAETRPPRLDGSWRDWPALWRTGRALRGLNLGGRQRLLTLASQSARGFLDQWFESDAIKAVFGFDSVVGHFGSPDEPGSAYVLLHHVFGEINGKQGAWGHPVGGMGAITQAMQRACESLGARVLLNHPVKRVLVDDGRAVGVEAEGGDCHYASLVLANVNPKLLFQRMLGPGELPAEFEQRIAAYRMGSGTLRMNVALAELPQFSCLPADDVAEHHQSGIIMAPSLDYMDRAYRDARTTGWSQAPIVEMTLPTAVDDSLAPRGAHVASLFCQQFARHLPDGRSWDDIRDHVADRVIDTVTQFAPNFRRAVIGRQILTPLDLERTFGLTDGDIMHGHLALDQLWAARPALGYGSYRTPIRGLYLCGAGAHPGGGVTGLPGRNAALAALDDGDWR